MKNIDLFLNDFYRTIKILKENEIVQKGKKYIPITQDEIAEQLNCSKAKVNKYLRILIDKGYVEAIQQGKYKLNPSSYQVYDFIER